MQPTPGNEERTLAALAHAGIVANGFNLLGIIAAAVIWFTQRERSSYVAGQALQALVYQIAGLLLGMLLICGWLGCIGLSLVPAVLRPDLYRTEPPLLFWLALAAGLFVLLLALLWAGYGLVAAWAAWRGLPFRYALFGRVVERQQRSPAPVVSPLPTEGAEPALEAGEAGVERPAHEDHNA